MCGKWQDIANETAPGIVLYGGWCHGEGSLSLLTNQGISSRLIPSGATVVYNIVMFCAPGV